MPQARVHTFLVVDLVLQSKNLQTEGDSKAIRFGSTYITRYTVPRRDVVRGLISCWYSAQYATDVSGGYAVGPSGTSTLGSVCTSPFTRTRPYAIMSSAGSKRALLATSVYVTEFSVVRILELNQNN